MEKSKAELKPLNDLRNRAKDLLNQSVEELQSIGDNDVRKLVNELCARQIELDIQNEKLRRAQVEIEESRQKYADLYDLAPVGYLTLTPKGLIVEANLTSATLLGEDRRDLIERAFSSFIASEFQDLFFSHHQRVIETLTKQTCELQLEKKDGTSFYASLESIAVQNSEMKVYQIHTNIIDITERKKVEKALHKAQENLERQVEERTLELKGAAEELKDRQEQLFRKKSELEKVNKELMGTNRAISILARNIDKNKQEMEYTIAKKINSMLMPTIKDLRKANTLDGVQYAVDILATQLQALANDLTGNMNLLGSLTPTEMRVAMMIKNGLTSQDLANKLNISLHTAKTHRRNLRKKLNVQNSRINLTSYLRSIMW